MYLKIVNINDNVNQSSFARKELRRFIYEKFWEDYEVLFWKDNKPIYSHGIYWSIAHKKDFIFLWISRNIIWVDIELYKERSIDFLDFFSKEEYNILWWKTWLNLYILWTAKESVIKYMLWNLDDMKYLSLEWFKVTSENIYWINFTYNLDFSYNWLCYSVLSWKKNKKIYSVCY